MARVIRRRVRDRSIQAWPLAVAVSSVGAPGGCA